MSERIVVDPIKLAGHGICAELFPERIGLDDRGSPMIVDAAVPPELREHPRNAVRSCPPNALRLVRRGLRGPSSSS